MKIPSNSNLTDLEISEAGYLPKNRVGSFALAHWHWHRKCMPLVRVMAT
jgi:hypothetical protein